MLTACGTKALLEAEHSRQGHCVALPATESWLWVGFMTVVKVTADSALPAPCTGRGAPTLPLARLAHRGLLEALGFQPRSRPGRGDSQASLPGGGGWDGGREGFVWGFLCECALSLLGKPHSVKALGFLKRSHLSEEAGHVALRPRPLRSAHPEPVDSPGHTGRPGPGAKALPPGFPRGWPTGPCGFDGGGSLEAGTDLYLLFPHSWLPEEFWPGLQLWLPQKSGSLRLRALIPFVRTPSSWPNHLPKAPPPNPIPLGTLGWTLKGHVAGP